MAISIFFYCEINIFLGGVFLKKICDPGGYNIAPCPNNCAWRTELNDTTLDFLAPPEDPHPTLSMSDPYVIMFWVISNSKVLKQFSNRVTVMAKYYKSINEILNDLNNFCAKYLDFVKEKVTTDEKVVLNNNETVTFAPKSELKTN
jgi:hypothetical protein